MKKLFENWKRYTEGHEDTGTVSIAVGGRVLHIPSSIFTWLVENRETAKRLIDHLEKGERQYQQTRGEKR
jgi:hypothetical protein